MNSLYVLTQIKIYECVINYIVAVVGILIMSKQWRIYFMYVSSYLMIGFFFLSLPLTFFVGVFASNSVYVARILHVTNIIT